MSETTAILLLLIWNISLCCLFMFEGALAFINLAIFISIPIYIMKKENIL